MAKRALRVTLSAPQSPLDSRHITPVPNGPQGRFDLPRMAIYVVLAVVFIFALWPVTAIPRWIRIGVAVVLASLLSRAVVFLVERGRSR